MDKRGKNLRSEPRLSREDLVALVARIQSVDWSEAEMVTWLQTLKANVAHPEVSNLIFWSQRPMTAEEIVDEALAWQVPAMPPPGESHFLWAVRTDDTRVVRILLENGADSTEVSSDGRTALQLASEYGHLEIAQLLTDGVPAPSREE